MVTPLPSQHEPTRRDDRTELFRQAPLVWRALMRIGRLIVDGTGRLEVTGDIPDELRARPLLLAANHIGNVDALVLIAACDRRRIAPRFLATGGLFEAPVLGRVLRASQHIRVDRGTNTAGQALERGTSALVRRDHPILVYPEGRISLEPGLWPERGKTGLARMALASGAPVIPVSQWGAHEVVHYGEPINGPRQLGGLFVSWLRALLRRPTLRVRFGEPVDLTGLDPNRVGDAVRAHARIMRAIAEGLKPLRAAEPEAPRHFDPTRPVSGKRSPWRPD